MTLARPASSIRRASLASSDGGAGARVDDHRGDVAALDLVARHLGGDVLGQRVDRLAAPHARGVDQHVLAPAERERRVDRIARGAGRVVHQHALLAEQAVHQRRLADVGLADERQPHDVEANRLLGGLGLGLAVAVAVRRLSRIGVGVDVGVVVGIIAVRAPARARAPNALTIASSSSPMPRPCEAEIGNTCSNPSAKISPTAASRRAGVDLVGGDEHRLARPAQHARDVLVDGGDALHRVDDEHDQVGLVDGAQGLRAHRLQDPVGRGIEPAGVDDAEVRTVPVALAVATVARHAGHVLDQRRAPADEPVEQRRLADVGAPDQRAQRQPPVVGGDRPRFRPRALLHGA